MHDPPTLSLNKPDDWHLHVRGTEPLRRVLQDTVRRFARTIIMPNLVPSICSTEQAREYRDRIAAAVPCNLSFQRLMTLFLTEETSPTEIVRAKASRFMFGMKWYAAGATTNAEHGVREVIRCCPVLEALEEQGLPLLVHAETTDPDMFERQAVFLDRQLAPVIRRFPGLRVVVEHVATRNAVQFVRDASPLDAGTITAHHLLLNRNSLFDGGLRPHHYCQPVLKWEPHRLALVEAATSGHARFFFGTDSAPHPRRDKEAACGCAGIYTAQAAIERYSEVFEQADALDRLEPFASFHGADFYGLPRNSERITLVKKTWHAAASLGEGDDCVIPFRANQTVAWQLAEVESK